MALATQCPMCETVFRITTAQAAAKSGTVRCGQCYSVFNALDVLVRVEDLEFEEPALRFDDDFDEPDAIEAAEFAESESTHAPATVAPPERDAFDDADEAEVAPAVEPPSTADPSDSPPTVREWWVPAEGEAVAPLAAPLPQPDARPEPSLADRRLSAGLVGREETAFLERDDVRPARSRTERIVLALLSLVAALALAAQAAYAFRDEIAARSTWTRPMLDAACASLGCRVGYPAHFSSITIESTNVETTADANRYVLTALLRNREGLELRHPALVLTLTDSQDQPVLRRVLRPEDYLTPDRLHRGFAPDSELPIRIAFETGELRFLGYRLDRFYP